MIMTLLRCSYFFLFVSSSTLLYIYVLAMSALCIKFLMDEGYPTVWKAFKHYPASLGLLIYCFIALTTYENFRYRSDSRPNIYNQGCLNNFLEVFCSKTKPSKHKIWVYEQEEVQPPTVFGREFEEPVGALVVPGQKLKMVLKLVAIFRRFLSGAIMWSLM
ncbi:hypothetical protein U9M48_044148 [Paspalum notatum var. saurae]|uniref:Uncharacterized protein n=1 Tax=Paspalum notatum var. saurae TaxID=547442 RepID=A0AAQ3V0R5_PASNO